jgi:hypothetical protein
VERANELTRAAAQKLLNQVDFHFTRIGKAHYRFMLDKSVISNIQNDRRFRIVSLCRNIDANGGAAFEINFGHDNPQMLGCVRGFRQKESIATLESQAVRLPMGSTKLDYAERIYFGKRFQFALDGINVGGLFV